MAVRLNPSSTTTRTKEYIATQVEYLSIKAPVVVSGSCCYAFNCNVDLPAIANLTDTTDDYSNDILDFIYQMGKGTTITATLIKVDSLGNETEYTLDATYGQIFATDTVKTGYWAYVLEWHKVATALSYGTYKISISIDNAAANEIYSETTSCFNLMPYNCDNAHNTVRITTEQKGYFEGGFDYSNLNYNYTISTNQTKAKTSWKQQIRLWGKFKRTGWLYEIDNIVSDKRGLSQVQSQTIRKYNLRIDYLESAVSNKVVEDMLQAPEVYIDDYNINNVDLYQKTRVSLTDIQDPEQFDLAEQEFFNFDLVDYYQSNVHRYK